MGTSSQPSGSKSSFPEGTQVAVKILGHPVWPGQIIREGFAPERVRKLKQPNQVLVIFFGDNSFGWYPVSELAPFADRYPSMHKSTEYRSNKTYKRAVEEAKEVLDRRSGVKPATKHEPLDMLKPETWARLGFVDCKVPPEPSAKELKGCNSEDALAWVQELAVSHQDAHLFALDIAGAAAGLVWMTMWSKRTLLSPEAEQVMACRPLPPPKPQPAPEPAAASRPAKQKAPPEGDVEQPAAKKPRGAGTKTAKKSKKDEVVAADSPDTAPVDDDDEEEGEEEDSEVITQPSSDDESEEEEEVEEEEEPGAKGKKGQGKASKPKSKPASKAAAPPPSAKSRKPSTTPKAAAAQKPSSKAAAPASASPSAELPVKRGRGRPPGTGKKAKEAAAAAAAAEEATKEAIALLAYVYPILDETYMDAPGEQTHRQELEEEEEGLTPADQLPVPDDTQTRYWGPSGAAAAAEKEGDEAAGLKLMYGGTLQIDLLDMVHWVRDLASYPLPDPTDKQQIDTLVASPEAVAVLRCKEAHQRSSCLHRHGEVGMLARSAMEGLGPDFITPRSAWPTPAPATAPPALLTTQFNGSGPQRRKPIIVRHKPAADSTSPRKGQAQIVKRKTEKKASSTAKKAHSQQDSKSAKKPIVVVEVESEEVSEESEADLSSEESEEEDVEAEEEVTLKKSGSKGQGKKGAAAAAAGGSKKGKGQAGSSLKKRASGAVSEDEQSPKPKASLKPMPALEVEQVEVEFKQYANKIPSDEPKFQAAFQRWQAERAKNLSALPQVGPFTWQPYDILQLVAAEGGCECVTKSNGWIRIAEAWQERMNERREAAGKPALAHTSVIGMRKALEHHYRQLLLPFENFLSSKCPVIKQMIDKMDDKGHLVYRQVHVEGEEEEQEEQEDRLPAPPPKRHRPPSPQRDRKQARAAAASDLHAFDDLDDDDTKPAAPPPKPTTKPLPPSNTAAAATKRPVPPPTVGQKRPAPDPSARATAMFNHMARRNNGTVPQQAGGQGGSAGGSSQGQVDYRGGSGGGGGSGMSGREADPDLRRLALKFPEGTSMPSASRVLAVLQTFIPSLKKEGVTINPVKCVITADTKSNKEAQAVLRALQPKLRTLFPEMRLNRTTAAVNVFIVRADERGGQGRAVPPPTVDRTFGARPLPPHPALEATGGFAGLVSGVSAGGAGKRGGRVGVGSSWGSGGLGSAQPGSPKTGPGLGSAGTAAPSSLRPAKQHADGVGSKQGLGLHQDPRTHQTAPDVFNVTPVGLPQDPRRARAQQTGQQAMPPPPGMHFPLPPPPPLDTLQHHQQPTGSVPDMPDPSQQLANLLAHLTGGPTQAGQPPQLPQVATHMSEASAQLLQNLLQSIRPPAP